MNKALGEVLYWRFILLFGPLFFCEKIYITTDCYFPDYTCSCNQFIIVPIMPISWSPYYLDSGDITKPDIPICYTYMYMVI